MSRSSQGSSKWVEDPEVPANGQDCDGTNAFKLLSGHISPALQVPPGKPTRQCKDTESIANMGQAIQTASILSQSLVHFTTDHSYSDHRIALQIEVLRWLMRTLARHDQVVG